MKSVEKRYQVFVSSTYEDLRAERQEVMQALLALDCIPTGMEFFPAADESQWALIRRVIRACDYYIVIIGKKYGTLGPGGKSYTEMEYKHASSIGKPVMAFLEASPESKGDQALADFRELAKKSRLVRFWSDPQELAREVTQAITHAKQTKPGGGWIRVASLPKAAFARTPRGRTVLESVAETGIKDIELWNLSKNSLPPESFFKAAREEIVISAATGYATLHAYGKLLGSISATGKRIYFLLLHPSLAAPDLELYSLRDDQHNKDMLSESQHTLDLVRAERYDTAFRFRFRTRLPPFTAVMIDGDLEHVNQPADSRGQLRMHPCSNYSFGSQGGLIIHLAKDPRRHGAFDYYAADLRMQWRQEGRKDPALFAKTGIRKP